ncbi:MAG: hypothetical protein GX802_00955 [Clostridiales bacterium]|nr:hypothetical protein [Clostridiales bacterium]
MPICVIIYPSLLDAVAVLHEKLETVRAVLEVFIEAYNKFGIAKLNYRTLHKTSEVPFGVVDFLE